MSAAPATPRPAGDEFYVGYLPAPRGVARFARRAAEALAALAVLIAVATAAAQRPPGRGGFQAGEPSRHAVTVYAGPVPLCLWQSEGGASRWLLVVGERKFGAPGALQGLPLGVRTQALGIVIAPPGETGPGCFELASQAPGGPAAAASHEGAKSGSARERALGRLTLRGQIIDPKCHFGAMKPGEGKVHRACAARCIAGGIPPVLLVREATPAGERLRSYILLGREGQPVNDRVLDFVAENVEITGEASSLLAPDGAEVGGDALRVIRVDPSTIKRLP